jgi:hypothetical protein
MPGFRVDGTVVANYAAFSKQCGLCLLRVAISDHAEEIAAAGFKAIKTGITFPPRRPIPTDSSNGWRGHRRRGGGVTGVSSAGRRRSRPSALARRGVASRR